jgi:hypothetical protein
MGEGDRRWGNSGLALRNDNSGPQQSCYRNEPFVLAKDVNQVFYVKGMSSKPKKGKTNDNSSDNKPKTT